MEPRFLVDGMLGTTVKWLRAMGVDTIFKPDEDDSLLLREAASTGRILLTSDRELARRGGPLVRLIETQILEEQIAAALKGTSPALLNYNTGRCLCCNNVLDFIRGEEYQNLIPKYVFKIHDVFMRCSGCKRIYWEGTHVEGIRKQVEKLRRYLAGDRT